MGADEPFLTRWSRRKLSGDADAQPENAPETSAVRPDTDASAAAETEGHERPAEIDLSQLPPLDSIGAATDIRAFLARGVPAALSRAALRRAWAADPAIRDFIGLAENSWDFTAPDGVPGFGPLISGPGGPSIADLAGRRPVSGPASSPEPEAAGPADSKQAGADLAEPQSEPIAAENHHRNVNPADPSGGSSTTSEESAVDRMADKTNEDVAMRKPSIADELGDVSRRRRHGGALPG